MDISNLSSASLQSLLGTPPPTSATPSSAPSSAAAAAQSSPAVQAASIMASSESALFSSISGGSGSLPDLSGLTAAAQAYSLYTNPALLQQLAGGGAPSAATSSGAVFTPPAYSFNPFDEASWWTDPSSLGATVDATA